MCGLAGFTNVPDPEQRELLILALGLGTDTRGRHSAGYVSAIPRDGANPPRIHYGRKSGPWETASEAFLADAGRGTVTVLHSRYATCGTKADHTAEVNAHPFAIRRADRTHLWGAHNGMIDNARDSAKSHKRSYPVDSRELFELLADGNLAAIGELEGYGTIAWIERSARDRVRLVKLTPDAELVIGVTECGAAVFASTQHILDEALFVADMKIKTLYECAPGKVLEAHADGRVTYSLESPSPLLLRDRPKFDNGWLGSYYSAGGRAGRDRDRDRGSLADFGSTGYSSRRGWGDDDFDPGDPAATDELGPDEGEAGHCPECDSVDTWLWDEQGQCADCGATWPCPVKGPTSASAASVVDFHAATSTVVYDDDWNADDYLRTERARLKRGGIIS